MRDFAVGVSGVAYSLRKFHAVIADLVRAVWAELEETRDFEPMPGCKMRCYLALNQK
jgi:hypothetical protein